MTKPDGEQQAPKQQRTSATARCQQCRRVIALNNTGRPKKFCSQACRQRHWVSQQRAAELQLSETELVVATSELDRLRDQLWVLECAVSDAERDLQAAGAKPSARELLDIVQWLLDAARPLGEH